MYTLTETQIRCLIKIISERANLKQQYLYCFRTKKLTKLGFILVISFLNTATEYFIHKYTGFRGN